MSPSSAAAILLSDVHLSDERPQQVERFLAVLAGPARAAGALYILGDLFEYWVGDDDQDAALPRRIIQALADLSAADCAVYLVVGNRDFLLGQAFAARTGAVLLDDPVCVDLCGTPTILMHGDLLCTDDVSYLRFRDQVRTPAWQQAFLAQPLAVRHQIARGATAESGRAKQQKHEDIMDVTTQAVAEVFRQFAASRLIHGHTHRPATHTHLVDGRPCKRWVLPDWYVGGGYLRADASGLQRIQWAADPAGLNESPTPPSE